MERAVAVYDFLDMYPLVVRHEIPGYLSDRLQEALWRETLHLVNDGVATTAELDDAIIYGPGLRWAGMGTNLTFHLAGGREGMRHMLEQFGPALVLPWSKLEAPELTGSLVDAMVEGTPPAGRRADRRRTGTATGRLPDRHHAGRCVRWAWAPVRFLARREARRYSETSRIWSEGTAVPAPLELYRCDVEPDWVDYNQHMTEAAYLTAFRLGNRCVVPVRRRRRGIPGRGDTPSTPWRPISTTCGRWRGNDSLRFTTLVVGLDDKTAPHLSRDVRRYERRPGGHNGADAVAYGHRSRPSCPGRGAARPGAASHPPRPRPPWTSPNTWAG